MKPYRTERTSTKPPDNESRFAAGRRLRGADTEIPGKKSAWDSKGQPEQGKWSLAQIRRMECVLFCCAAQGSNKEETK